MPPRSLPREIIRIRQFQHGLAQLDFAQQQQPGGLGIVWKAVVCRFGGHVRKVDALVTHVSIDRSLWWCNAETLGQDTAKVRGPRAMPQEAAVSWSFGVWGVEEELAFAFALDAEDVFNLLM